MHSIEWEFLPKPSSISEFLAAYGPEGHWVKLFRNAEGYIGTELVQVADKPGWYRTIDRWTSKDAYAKFQRQFSEKYRILDAECEHLTLQEEFIKWADGPEQGD